MKNGIVLGVFFVVMGVSATSFASTCSLTVEHMEHDCIEVESQYWGSEDGHCVFDLDITNNCQDVVSVEIGSCFDDCAGRVFIKPGETGTLNYGESHETSYSEHQLDIGVAGESMTLNVWTQNSDDSEIDCMVLEDNIVGCTQAGGEFPLSILGLVGLLAIRQRRR